MLLTNMLISGCRLCCSDSQDKWAYYACCSSFK